MWHLTHVDSEEPVQPLFKLRNSNWCSVSSLKVIEYSSDKQRLWSDCAYAQADLRLCWSHIPHCWKSHVTAHIKCPDMTRSSSHVWTLYPGTSSNIRTLYPGWARFDLNSWEPPFCMGCVRWGGGQWSSNLRQSTSPSFEPHSDLPVHVLRSDPHQIYPPIYYTPKSTPNRSLNFTSVS